MLKWGQIPHTALLSVSWVCPVPGKHLAISGGPTALQMLISQNNSDRSSLLPLDFLRELLNLSPASNPTDSTGLRGPEHPQVAWKPP